MGQQVFYGALWGSMLVSPQVRLPATLFIVNHFDRTVSPRRQTHMLGYDHRLVVSICVCSCQEYEDSCTVRTFLQHMLGFILHHYVNIGYSPFSCANKVCLCVSPGEGGVSDSARL